MRSMRYVSAAMASSTLVCAACDRAPSTPPHRPNIVLVSIDSLRYDHLGCYGYAKPTTPTLDALAARGVRFQNAVSTTSWTLPAHAALFTGLCDSTHGVYDNGLRLAPAQRTLAEVLRDAGYFTAGFFSGPYLHPVFGLGDGFDVYQSCMTTIADDASDQQLRAESRARNAKSHDDVTGPRIVDEITRWVASAPRDRPVLLFIHMWDVHYDYIPPPEYARMFDSDYTGALTGAGVMSNAAINPRMDPRDLQHLLALYDGEIRFTDDNLGRILDVLRSAHLLDNALIAVLADHGEEFFEHGNKGHQRSLFDESVRVPLIFDWPGHIEPRVVDDQVSLIDVMPTLLAIAQVRDVPAMQGRDVRPLLVGERIAPQTALCELRVDGRDVRALRTNEFKSYEPGGAQPGGGFDLVRDPGELHGLRAPDQRVVTGLAQLASTLEGALGFRDRIGSKREPVEIDADLRRRLHQLGYVDGATQTPSER